MTSCSEISHDWGPLLRRIPLQGLSSVCKSVPVSPPWGFSPLTWPVVAPACPFPSLLLLLNWDLIHFHTWLYSKPLWNPTLGTPSGIDGLLLRLCLEDHHFLLGPSKGLSFIFFLCLPGQVPQASLGGKVRALRIRLRNLNVIRLLVNSSTNEYFQARHDMTGPVFREVLLQVKKERVN